MAQKDGGFLIIRRSRKSASHGHHGGAWKVAYADFVTAMMAFFLLLWLLNAATKEQLRGISDYFAPISTKSSTSGGGGLLAGRKLAKVGVLVDDAQGARSSFAPPPAQDGGSGAGQTGADEPPPGISDAELDAYLRKREEQQFREAEKQIQQAIAGSSELQSLADSLLIDDTPEGLRIQIIDQAGLPMFPRGEAEMYPHTRRMLEMVAQVVQKMPQAIDITGHTDATRYQGGRDYSNWELSADRANAARRALVQFGVPERRIARVVGKAQTDPLVASDPEAPGNRRLSLVMLRRTGTAAAGAEAPPAHESR